MATKNKTYTFGQVRLDLADSDTVADIRKKISQGSATGSATFPDAVRYLLECYRQSEIGDPIAWAEEVYS